MHVHALKRYTIACLPLLLLFLIPLLPAALTSTASAAPAFTRLVPLPAPGISAASDPYAASSSRNYSPNNLLDGNPATEFASASLGTRTFVEFDFGAPTSIAAFSHHERADIATIAASELIFLDAAGKELRRIPATHAGRQRAVTFQPVTPAITASRVRWQITKLGSSNFATVGGAEVTLFTTAGSEALPSADTVQTKAPFIAARDSVDGVVKQPVRIEIDHPYAEPFDATVQLGAFPPRQIRIVPGPQSIEIAIPTSRETRSLPLTITAAGASDQTVVHASALEIPPFREITVYVVQHSHVDIGYTETQTVIEEKQINNLLAGMDIAERTAGYPEGSRFVWNLENLWPADLYLQRLAAPHRVRFFNALRDGRVAADGMYFNILTGLCRPEDLIRLFRYGTQLGEQAGIKIDSAQISDVPGYVWGTVTALNQAGIKYFSPAPNNFDRIGTIMSTMDNKPFWWVGPDGNARVLTWIASDGYSFAHKRPHFTPELVDNFLNDLLSTKYPYDITYLRWSRGDNGPPDADMVERIREWNAAHAWPHFKLASTSEAFSAFEKKYGAQLPEYRGDWTPYWEDGAGSSACETAQTRASSDRFAQAETLYAMLAPADYPARDFADAMRHIHLYEEHTWGASRSVTVPDDKRTTDQWTIKSSYSATADAQTRALLSRSLALASATGAPEAKCIDVFNTNSWARSGLVTISREIVGSARNLRVLDDTGAPVASQRLSTYALVIWADNIPPFASRRYTITEGEAHKPASPVTVTKTTLDNGILKISIDEKTGAITGLRSTRAPDPAHNFAAATADGGSALNAYLYFTGSDSSKTQTSGAPVIRIKERGPLVSSIVVESPAPGCHNLVREITLAANCDYALLDNLVDKQRIPGKNYRDVASKESVNFAFPFNVPGGQMRLDVPFGIMRPETDQIPGSCKNWFTVNRWADVSNNNYGITWVTLDAPLVQLGALTANLLNSQTNPAVWRTRTGPTQTLYSWVMNNHWGTNYRAYQEGPVTFRYLLRPHAAYDPAAATRLAIAASTPLLPARAFGEKPNTTPRLEIDSPDIVVTAMKPSDDGRALIVRLWNASERAATISPRWPAPAPRRVTLSDTSELPRAECPAKLEIPAQALITLRAELQ